MHDSMVDPYTPGYGWEPRILEDKDGAGLESLREHESALRGR